MAYPSLNDTQLVNLLTNDDEAAFGEIYKRYAHGLAAFAGPRLHSIEDARDIIHDIFVKLWEERQELVVTSNLQTYLFTIARYRVADRIRRDIMREEYAKLSQSLAEDQKRKSETRLNAKDLQKRVDRALHIYLAGEATAEEARRVEVLIDGVWIENSRWLRMNEAGRKEWLDGLFVQIQDSIAGRKSGDAKRFPVKFLWWSITFLAILFITLLIVYQFRSVEQHHASARSLTSVTAPQGEIKQVDLPDGSRSWLNSGAELSYPPRFNSATMEVWLSGEGYFETKEDRSRSFIIHSGTLVITASGATVNVRQDKALNNTRVTAIRGKVNVSSGGVQLAALNPGQQLRFNLLSKGFSQSNVDTRQAIAWQQALSFDNTPLEEVAARLERRFDAQIIFDNDNLKTCRFTGAFSNDAKLDNILKQIAATSHVTCETDSDGTIVISGVGCEAKQVSKG